MVELYVIFQFPIEEKKQILNDIESQLDINMCAKLIGELVYESFCLVMLMQSARKPLYI